MIYEAIKLNKINMLDLGHESCMVSVDRGSGYIGIIASFPGNVT
jgi:hypothetical protein